MIHNIYIYNIVDRYVRLLIDASVQYYLLHGEGYYDCQRRTWRSGGRVPKSIGWRYASKAFAANLNLHFVCKKMFCVSIKIRYSWNPVVEIQMFPKFHGHRLWLIKIKQNTNHSMQAAFYRFILPGPVWRCLRQDVGNFYRWEYFTNQNWFDKSLYSVYT